jgi:hypothetical protein
MLHIVFLEEETVVTYLAKLSDMTLILKFEIAS